VAFSPDGKRVVTGGGDRTVRVWDTLTGASLAELKGHIGPVMSVSFSADGTRIVSASRGTADKPGEVFVWDAPLATDVELVGRHTDFINAVVFSPDGTRIATAGEDVKVWDARTGSPLLELKGFKRRVTCLSFSADGTRIATGETSDPSVVKVWDATTGTELAELKTGFVKSVAFGIDGTRIVTGGHDNTTKVWDAKTGQELKGEAVPSTVSSERISPDGRLLVHLNMDRALVIPLIPEEEVIAYRRLHTQPSLSRYRAGYLAARAANDDFAARFYLNLLPPPEQRILKAQAAADREIGAGRTPDALVHLVTVSAGKADDTSLALRVATLQAWFGQNKELADSCGRALEAARGTFDPLKWGHLARICCLHPTPDTTRREAALALARKAVEPRKDDFSIKLTLGMAEYRSGHFAEADAALLAAADGARKSNNPSMAGTATFYRALSLFRQGKENEARQLAAEATATMKPLPEDEKNPLAGGASPDDLILWLGYKEAKGLIHFDAAPAASEGK
jgi:hypothetical protein